MFVEGQGRETDMDIFFQHKNNRFPPSLSVRGKLRIGKESDLLKCLTTAPRTENQNLLGNKGFHDENDLAVCLRYVQMVDVSVDKLDTVEVDEDFLLVPEQLQAVDHWEPPEIFGTKVFEGSAVIIFFQQPESRPSKTSKITCYCLI